MAQVLQQIILKKGGGKKGMKREHEIERDLKVVPIFFKGASLSD